MISRTAAGLHANRLLGLLPRRDCAQLHPYLQRVQLDYRQSLYRANRPIEYVYFIETGVGSLVNTMANGDAAEVGRSATRAWWVCPFYWATTEHPPAFTSRFPVPASE
jgi:hypothetical protein